MISYPKYVNPNSDSYNDKWNVSELQEQYGSKIHIFDQYIKLLIEVKLGNLADCHGCIAIIQYLEMIIGSLSSSEKIRFLKSLSISFR